MNFREIVMGDEKASKIADAASAVKGVMEEAPIYKDALQPAAKQVGTALETVGKAVNLVLGPIAALVWGWEQIKDIVMPSVAYKLQKVATEQLQVPKLTVVGPAIEALKFTGHEPTLREMYVNLLATAIDSATAENAHPAFVHIIRCISPDEAIMLRFLATQPKGGVSYNCQPEKSRTFLNDLLAIPSQIAHPHLIQAYIDNTKALGVTWGLSLNLGSIDGKQTHTNSVLLTQLGKQFITACVTPPEHASSSPQKPPTDKGASISSPACTPS
jgi:hypothetical protein